MIDIWNSFPDGDKPEWLTMEQIKEFAQKMGVDIWKEKNMSNLLNWAKERLKLPARKKIQIEKKESLIMNVPATKVH